jgi:hypothetical protein
LAMLQERRTSSAIEKAVAPVNAGNRNREKTVLPAASRSVIDTPVSNSIYIDAMTETVKIKLVSSKGFYKRFEGIYILNGKQYSDDQLRELLAATGYYEFRLPSRPILAYYSPGDEQAVQRWGTIAQKGVILIQPSTAPTDSINP